MTCIVMYSVYYFVFHEASLRACDINSAPVEIGLSASIPMCDTVEAHIT